MSNSKYAEMSDESILEEMGRRLSRHRLNLNVTQAALAREGGIARRTVSKAENGKIVDSRSLLRILRALDLLEGLDALVPRARVSPVSLVETQGRRRARASGVGGGSGAGGLKEAEWTWPTEEE